MDILYSQTHVVPRKILTHSLIVSFSRLYGSCDTDRQKGSYHVRFANTRFHLAPRVRVDANRFITVLEEQTQRPIGWRSWW